MKKSLAILALSILLWGCNRQEYLPPISPTYDYFVNGVKQYNLSGLSFASIDSATHDTLIYLFDDQNKASKLELRFNNEKIEAVLAYNDTIYRSSDVYLSYTQENGKLYGKFYFNALNGLKMIEVAKGRFNDIKIN